MKLRIVASALLIMVLSVSAVSEASARPWGYRGGWGGPRIGVRVGVPAVVVGGGYGPGYYGGYGPGYYGGYGPGYYGGGYAYGGGPRYYGGRYYGGGPRYAGGYYHGGGYRGGGYHGGGYHGGGRGRR